MRHGEQNRGLSASSCGSCRRRVYSCKVVRTLEKGLLGAGQCMMCTCRAPFKLYLFMTCSLRTEHNCVQLLESVRLFSRTGVATCEFIINFEG